MTVQPMPAAELPVSVELVRHLLVEQHADLAGLPVEVLANGWDNLVCRLGDELLVRLPRRELGAELLVHEQRWLPQLAGRLPLPVPVPVRVGRPAEGYPWAWSVVPYLPGRNAGATPPEDLGAAAGALGGFLAALHTPAPADAPVSAFRGVPLVARHQRLLAALEKLPDPVDREAARRVWEGALAAPAWDGPRLWLHGDLHPANLLVHQGRLSAVIDFGDVTSGDPATDLSVAWMLLPAAERAVFRAAYGAADDATWERARGWALLLSLVFLLYSADNPLMAGIGERAFRAALA